MSRNRPNSAIISLVALLYAVSAAAQGVVMPAGTVVYGELDQAVTSKKKETNLGDFVRARVWRDVIVDGRVVIRAGAPMIVRVSKVRGAKVAGRKGQLELEAVSVTGVGGSEVLLDGGYDKSGKSRMGASIALFVIVAWPLIFIKGKQAVLEPGTVFDSVTQADVRITASGWSLVRIDLREPSGLSVVVLYDEMNPDKKEKNLPIEIRNCAGEIDAAAVVSVNDVQISHINIKLDSTERDGDCYVSNGKIELAKLAKHFRKGINRFEVAVGDSRTEVMLEVEI